MARQKPPITRFSTDKHTSIVNSLKIQTVRFAEKLVLLMTRLLSNLIESTQWKNSVIVVSQFLYFYVRVSYKYN